jgi:DNA-binding phage protein
MEKLSPTVKTIKAEMERQKTGVYELSEAAGIAPSTLYRILAGETIPSLETAENLMKALGMRLIGKR